MSVVNKYVVLEPLTQDLNPSVCAGPFDSAESAQAWSVANNWHGSVVVLVPPVTTVVTMHGLADVPKDVGWVIEVKTDTKDWYRYRPWSDSHPEVHASLRDALHLVNELLLSDDFRGDCQLRVCEAGPDERSEVGMRSQSTGDLL